MKILKISKCWQCCHKSAFSPYVCTLANPKSIFIHDVYHDEIPNWCPLEDAPQPAAEEDEVSKIEVKETVNKDVLNKL